MRPSSTPRTQNGHHGGTETQRNTENDGILGNGLEALHRMERDERVMRKKETTSCPFSKQFSVPPCLRGVRCRGRAVSLTPRGRRDRVR